MALKTLERSTLTVVGMQIRTQPMSAEIPALWPRFVTRIPEIQNQAEPRVSYGLMWHQQGSMAVLHYMAGVSVTTVGQMPRGMDIVTIPAGTYATFRYPFSRLAKGFGEIHDHLLASEFVEVSGPFFERYDESFDPNNPNSMVEICIPVQRRRAVVNS